MSDRQNWSSRQRKKTYKVFVHPTGIDDLDGPEIRVRERLSQHHAAVLDHHLRHVRHEVHQVDQIQRGDEQRRHRRHKHRGATLGCRRQGASLT